MDWWEQQGGYRGAARKRAILEQFLRFAGVGVVGTVAHYALLSFLVELLGADAVVASMGGALLGALVNYLLNRRFTFRSGKGHQEALTRFFIVAGIGLLLNGIFMTLFVDGLGLYYLLAQVFSTALVLVWNFAGNRWWTFNDAC